MGCHGRGRKAPYDPGRSGLSPWGVPRAADDELADLLIRLCEEGVEGRPPSLGLRNALKAALIYMRHNVVQAVIGEILGVSQPTVSRAIKALTEAISGASLSVVAIPAGPSASRGPPAREGGGHRGSPSSSTKIH